MSGLYSFGSTSSDQNQSQPQANSSLYTSGGSSAPVYTSGSNSPLYTSGDSADSSYGSNYSSLYSTPAPTPNTYNYGSTTSYTPTPPVTQSGLYASCYVPSGSTYTSQPPNQISYTAADPYAANPYMPVVYQEPTICESIYYVPPPVEQVNYSLTNSSNINWDTPVPVSQLTPVIAQPSPPIIPVPASSSPTTSAQATQSKPTTVTNIPVPKAKTGGLLGKISLVANQLSGAATDMVKEQLTLASRRRQYEKDLKPPCGGYVADLWEHLTKETKLNAAEVEFLYYEFIRHSDAPPSMKPTAQYEMIISPSQFLNLMPQCHPANLENYRRVVDAVMTVFRWGTQKVTFPTFTKAISLICLGGPADKLPILYDILMDQYHRVLTRNSLHWVLSQLQSLELVCVSAGNLCATPNDVNSIVADIFYDNLPSITLDQFIQRISSFIATPHPREQNWKILLDCVGLFPYFYYTFFSHVHQLARLQRVPPTIRPRKEGFLIKQGNSTISNNWNRHWTVVENGFLYYYPSDNEYDMLSRVVFIGDAEVEKKEGNDPPYRFEITQGVYKRQFCAEDENSLQYWLHVIRMNTTQGKNRYHSFAPVRERISGRWFIDGVDCYASIEAAMESAQEEIYITDWFLSPQVYLTRFDESGNPHLDPYHRLDVVLKRKADQGVKIYILPWSETKIAIELGSAFVKSFFESLSPNIKVLCHPLTTPIKWSHHQKTVIVDQKVAFVGGLDLCYGRWDTQKHSLTDQVQPYLHPGKDNYNPAIAEFSNVHIADEELLNRQKHPRMPWHDIHMMCDGYAARDVALNFIQRWNHHRDCLNQHSYIIPKNNFLPYTGNLNVQVIRSTCNWSTGVSITETSILNAYLEEIDKAENFIYIENQFFISATAGKFVENTISKAILKKVIDAVKNNRVFKVIIIVPVHPEGGFKNSNTVRYIMGWQYKTICRGAESMVETFIRTFPGVDVTQYFHFYIVQNWARMGDTLVTEQIYVHAKLIIIDDRTVIVGSANINDRSMIGVRDSEIGVIVTDSIMIDSTMNGVPYKVSKYAHELRCNLFLEHLGLSDSQISLVTDPICPETYSLWLNTARENSHILNDIFYKDRVIPFAEDKYQRLLKIRGHLSEYDQDFLTDNEMAKTQGMDTLLTTDDVFT